jgi:hypothetical protein
VYSYNPAQSEKEKLNALNVMMEAGLSLEARISMPQEEISNWATVIFGASPAGTTMII